MKTRLLICTIAFALFMFLAGCDKKKKDDFSIKFEITTTAPVAKPFPTIITNGGMSPATHDNFTSGNNWVYVTSLYTSFRPLFFALNGQNIRLEAAGSVTLSIYVNEKLQATSTRNSTMFGTEHVVSTGPIGYTVN